MRETHPASGRLSRGVKRTLCLVDCVGCTLCTVTQGVKRTLMLDDYSMNSSSLWALPEKQVEWAQ